MKRMKLVIDIDEYTYNDIEKGKVYTSVRDVPQEAVVAIANGKPLDSVLDEIRTDIKAMFPPSGNWMYDEGCEHEHTVCEVLVDVLQIIDKYKTERGGEE